METDNQGRQVFHHEDVVNSRVVGTENLQTTLEGQIIGYVTLHDGEVSIADITHCFNYENPDSINRLVESLETSGRINSYKEDDTTYYSISERDNL